MTLAAGVRLGHYTLLAPLGAGGMGEVWRAEDTTLKRQVALKVLPAAVATDPDRLARLQREAEAVAALNHPNIVTLYSVEQDAGVRFLTMELVEGHGLDQVIPRGGLPLAQVLDIGAAIADALVASHEKGIVHRDLKPANVMLAGRERRVKVLDFGLAKLREQTVDDAETATAHRTGEGRVLGTVAYMSPEQAEGRALDARSDLFSLGVVLFELATGARPFTGDTSLSVLSAILRDAPKSVTELRADLPKEFGRIVKRCLQKDPDQRVQTAKDVRNELLLLKSELASGEIDSATAANTARSRRWLWPAVAGACVVIASAAILWSSWRRNGGSESSGPELVRLTPDDGHQYTRPSISQDGKFVAYVSDRSGRDEVWLQQVGAGDPIQRTHGGVENAYATLFPDGTRILYLAKADAAGNRNLEVIPALSGEPKVVVRGGFIDRPRLSPDGRQIAYYEFKERHRSMVISADGGQARELSNESQIPDSHVAMWTSDSRHLLVPTGTMDWFVLPLDGGPPVRTGAGAALRAVGFDSAHPWVMIGDRVLFTGERHHARHPWEIRLGPDLVRVMGPPRQLAFGTEDEWIDSVSATGTAAMVTSPWSMDLYLIPLDRRTGQPTSAPRRIDAGMRKVFPWSAGGDPERAILLANDSGDEADVFALDLETGKRALLARVADRQFVISRDGRRVAEVEDADRPGIRLREAGADPSAARVVCKACGFLEGFSPDGRFLFVDPAARLNGDPTRKVTVGLVDATTGQGRPWLEHPTDSIRIKEDLFGEDGAWVVVEASAPGAGPFKSHRLFIVPWRDRPVPLSEWIEVGKAESRLAIFSLNFSRNGNLVFEVKSPDVSVARFDPKTRTLSAFSPVKFIPGPPLPLKSPDPEVFLRQGLVIGRRESTSSIWLMKLPK